MKKTLTLIFFLFFIQNQFIAQTCSGQLLCTQAEVDNLNCSTMNGTLLIGHANPAVCGGSTNINNLNNLSTLTFIKDGLQIYDNPNLTSLNGLGNVTQIGDNFDDNISIQKNTSLTDISALNNVSSFTMNGLTFADNGFINLIMPTNLTSITSNGTSVITVKDESNLTTLDYNNLATLNGGLSILNCNSLTSVVGTSLTNINNGRPLTIENCPSLTTVNFSGLTTAGNIILQNNVSSINSVNFSSLTTLNSSSGNGLDIRNTSLTDMSGFSALTSVAGDVFIYNNSNLTSLDGLDNLTSIASFPGYSENLNIQNNPNLNDCCAILDLINNGGVSGNIILSGNGTNCNSIAAIQAHCPLQIQPQSAFQTPVIADNGGGTNNVGSNTSLSVVNSNPAISYFDATNGDLFFVRASDALGTSWGTPIKVDDGGLNVVGKFTSLAVVNSNPAISYYDESNGDLYYVRASDASGTNWGTPVKVDDGGANDVGRYTSLSIVSGNPGISYYDATNGDLYFVRATDATGANWGSKIKIDDGGADDVGQYTSLEIVNNNPGISYYDATNGNLKFVRATDISGGNWGSKVNVDDGADNVGQYTSLEIVNGNPAISYYDATNGNLKYIRAVDNSGSDWGGSKIVVDDGGSNDVGQYTSLAISDNNPAICYYDVTNQHLNYVRATDASGTSWDTPIVVDNGGGSDNVGQFASMTIVNSNPAISYYDATNQNLLYTRASTTTGLPVDLIWFRAKSHHDEVKLEWQTASEINNEGFEVQWVAGSLQSAEWRNIGFVNGNGNSNTLQTYSYQHQNPESGINYYRLRQIDFDGNFEYSNVVSVDVQNIHSTPSISIFPNPNDGQFQIQLHNPKEQPYHLQLFDSKGVVIVDQFLEDDYFELETILPKGVYWVKAQFQGEVLMEKVVVH